MQVSLKEKSNYEDDSQSEPERRGRKITYTLNIGAALAQLGKELFGFGICENKEYLDNPDCRRILAERGKTLILHHFGERMRL